MKCFVYPHQDDPDKHAIAEAGAPTIMLLMWGFRMKPIYALRVKRWKRYV